MAGAAAYALAASPTKNVYQSFTYTYCDISDNALVLLLQKRQRIPSQFPNFSVYLSDILWLTGSFSVPNSQSNDSSAYAARDLWGVAQRLASMVTKWLLH